MDTGGLAQMTFANNNNDFSTSSGLGVPGSGFASRGKGGHIKRLSVAPPSNINSIYEDEVDANPPPRTSRSHLLAGLRTAPRAGNAVPASAPYSQTQHRFGLDQSGYSGPGNARSPMNMPQTAMPSYFSGLGHNQYHSGSGQQVYCSPDQVLAPPDLNMGNAHDEQMDPELYNDLMLQNLYLLQRQQQLQQQLMNVTAAAQQFQGLNLNHGHHAPATPITPHTSFYSQQVQNGVQPIINPVPNQPGVYAVYNPMTGQQTIFYDQSAHNGQMPTSPPLATPGYGPASPESEMPNFYRRDNMFSQASFAPNKPRTITPPKSTPSPPQQDVKPLPAPSSNAYRPGHRKSTSNALGNAVKSAGFDGIKNGMPRSAGFQATPTTGTFGLGMGRAGEHPIRQPRGPPPLEELVASPTAKHEGSRNFATRQRRRAVHNLVRAGNERRSGRNGDGGTPSSENELNFTISDADSEGTGSVASSSGNSSLSAIGSEWKELKGRTSGLNTPTNGHGVSAAVGGYNSVEARPDFAAAVKAADPSAAFRRESEKRKTPLLVLTSAAEKRKMSAF